MSNPLERSADVPHVSQLLSKKRANRETAIGFVTTRSRTIRSMTKPKNVLPGTRIQWPKPRMHYHLKRHRLVKTMTSHPAENDVIVNIRIHQHECKDAYQMMV